MTNDKTPLTAAEIAELRRLEAAATKGPWESNEEKRGMSTVFRYIRESTPFNKFGGKNCVVGYTSYLSSRDGEVGGPSITAVDANLIAALRNAAPRLLAAAEREGRLEAEVNEWEASFELYHACQCRAVKMYRDAGGDPNVLPDIGDLMVWLTTELKLAREALHEISKERDDDDQPTPSAERAAAALADRLERGDK